MCPKTCSASCLGLLPTTSLSTSTTLPTTVTTTQDCSINCVYGTAQVDKNGFCICVCNDKYFGSICDKLNITAVSSSPDPGECNYLACSDEDVIGLCPITCKSKLNYFICKNNLLLFIIFLVCGGAIFCQNGGTVNFSSCECNCSTNFSGEYCEKSSP